MEHLPPKPPSEWRSTSTRWILRILPLVFLFGYLEARTTVVARGENALPLDVVAIGFALYLVWVWRSSEREARRRLAEIDARRVESQRLIDNLQRAINGDAGAPSLEQLRKQDALHREAHLSDAAPRVLETGLPKELILTSRDMRIPQGLALFAAVGLIAFLSAEGAYQPAGMVSVMVAAGVVLTILYKAPRQLIANQKGLQIDGEFRSWREIRSIIKPVYGDKQMSIEVHWSDRPRPRWAVASRQPGSVAFVLRHYLPTREACENALATLLIWHSRAQQLEQDTTPSDFSRTLDEKMAAVEALAETDPEGAERLLEKSLAEMEALHQAELERHRPGRPK